MVLQIQNNKHGRLLLEDGTVYAGRSFGAERSVSGEAVFATAMVGYAESITDPSYRGQILVFTYPLIGNYGIPTSDVHEEGHPSHGLPQFFESRDAKPQVAGVVVSTYCEEHSHWAAVESLGAWLKRHNIPAIQGCDTRAITQVLRVKGSELARLVIGDTDPESIPLVNPFEKNLVAEVSIDKPVTLGSGGPNKIVVVDCGIKNNILRCLAEDERFTIEVVPWNHPIDEIEFDGLFLGNGPGDPTKVTELVDRLRNVLAKTDKPIFGICLGNQLMSLAAGAETYKMRFGNRGVNHPAVDQFTRQVKITSQNHGFAVDQKSLPEDWVPYFVNANDGSNEGIINTKHPWSCVQFHPESKAGPYDTRSMFKLFLDKVVEVKTTGKSTPYSFVNEPKAAAGSANKSIKKVIILGSGGLQIGQAGEFDYSGAQAIKAFREEGIETVLINPNVATVQTGRGMADKVYFVPVTREYIEKVFLLEKPDSIALGFGGQTALNVGVELCEKGILEKHGVKVIGTPVSAIRTTEDREKFNEALATIDVCFARSAPAETINEAVRVGREIGFPVMVRSAFSLGGLGSGICADEHELRERATFALATCPQVLVEESLRGWKEVEYEVVRDAYDNCVTVCNMENLDPMGVHTGESVVIAPSQTLSNEEYFKLREVAIKVIRHLGIIGESNIQYALDPNSEQYRVIEVNARLSRSSALASKATGYPLAFVAAKLACNIPLPDIRNAVTKTTTACFEPSLDYVVVKAPRWDLGKFPRVDRHIGTMMKSVGEVMAIGRNFAEALQKACRMSDGSKILGFEEPPVAGFYESAEDEMRRPTSARLFAIAEALHHDTHTIDEIHEITKIDKWWLSVMKDIDCVKREIHHHTLDTLPEDVLRQAKVLGFADRQIAKHLLVRPERALKAANADEGATQATQDSPKSSSPRSPKRPKRTDLTSVELLIREKRKKLGITPFIKQIDTLAAEFAASTNYLYVTYDASVNDVTVNDPIAQRAIVVGSGVYRIGSSVEFDFCCVATARALKRRGVPTCIINYNPETVSTDYDESDRLYFEEISFERVMDIYDAEIARGVVVSMGGQEPQNIALRLTTDGGANVFGTDPKDIDRAEDRQKFSAMLDSEGIDQPEWAELRSNDAAREFATQVGYPVLIRPSYVLSGAAMAVAHTPEQLELMLNNAETVSDDFPVVISKFYDGCKEIECDAIAAGGNLVNWAISEHIEDAGVHSGDATMIFPADTIGKEVSERVKDIVRGIGRELKISGPYNTQLLYNPVDQSIKVIETNLRASRSFPFVCKTLGIDFLETAVDVFLGNHVSAEVNCDKLPKYCAIKSPMFSFMRLGGADPQLGVEMKSTGEVASFGMNRHEALIKSMVATRGFKFPVGNVMVATSTPNPAGRVKNGLSNALREAQKSGGIGVYAADEITKGVLEAAGVTVDHTCPLGITRHNIGAAKDEDTAESAVGLMRLSGETDGDHPRVDLVIDLADDDNESITLHACAATADDEDDHHDHETVSHDHYLLRRSAADFGVSLVTDPGLAAAFLEGVAKFNKNFDALEVRPWDSYLQEAEFDTFLKQD